MGVSSRIPFHARHRHGAHSRNDQGEASANQPGRARRLVACLIFCLAGTANADPIRVATFNVELSRDGPGLLLRDILKDDDPQIAAAARVIAHVAPDVLLMTGFDFDHDGHALNAFADRIGDAGVVYEHRVALRPNSGLQSGRDLDGDGRTGGPADAQGYGTFAGQNGMAILSRLDLRRSDIQDFSRVLWADVPDSLVGNDPARDIQRLSTIGHWAVPIMGPGNAPFVLYAYHATPPVFDDEDDRNGRRNHDETAFWRHLIDGRLEVPAPSAPFVILGDANLDPIDGDGRSSAMEVLLSHPRLQDPTPVSHGGGLASALDGGVNVNHRGDPALDTADWPDAPGGPGNLRVDYVIPSSDWHVTDAGVFWPGPDDPVRALIGADGNAASRHRLVWVDLMLQR